MASVGAMRRAVHGRKTGKTPFEAVKTASKKNPEKIHFFRDWMFFGRLSAESRPNRAILGRVTGGLSV